MSLLKAILKLAAPLPDIEGFDSFMFIGPHPDDIEIGAGATAAKLAALGKRICFVICTDGRYGSATVPPGELIDIRKSEAIASARLLGITDVRFLGLSDGALYDTDTLTQKLARVIGEFKPEVIFAPDPSVTSECHADHLNVGEISKRMACYAPYENLMRGYGAESAPVKALALYFTAKPTRFVGTRGYLNKQLDSVFKCHLSQFPAGSPDGKSIALYLRLRSVDFGIRSLKLCAEGFRVLGVTQMHCFPEAGR